MGRTSPFNDVQLQQFMNIPGDLLARFVGIVDGEGTIHVGNHRGYIRIFLKISMHVRDLSLLQALQTNLLGLGTIYKEDGYGKVS